MSACKLTAIDCMTIPGRRVVPPHSTFDHKVLEKALTECFLSLGKGINCVDYGIIVSMLKPQYKGLLVQFLTGIVSRMDQKAFFLPDEIDIIEHIRRSSDHVLVLLVDLAYKWHSETLLKIVGFLELEVPDTTRIMMNRLYICTHLIKLMEDRESKDRSYRTTIPGMI